MRRYGYLLSPFLMLLMVSAALAQTITEVIEQPSTTIGAWAWKMLMLAITVGGSTVTPYLTKYLTMGALKVIGTAKANIPGPVLIFLSTLISAVFAGVMGANTDLPLHGDSAALMGAAVGGAAQKLANTPPEEVKPVLEATAPKPAL